jgi:hypothetical protein
MTQRLAIPLCSEPSRWLCGHGDLSERRARHGRHYPVSPRVGSRVESLEVHIREPPDE